MAHEGVEIEVDGRSAAGPFRRLSGVQGSPHPMMEGDANLIDRFREAEIDHVRFPQDCPPNTLTLAGIFPEANADPDNPHSYQFDRIDAHFAASRLAGASVLWQASYDVGQSDRWVGMNLGGRAPTDLGRWSRVVARCMCHFNASWADGGKNGLDAVEFPNEPDGLGGFGGNLPSVVPAFIQFLRTVETHNQEYSSEVRAAGPGIPLSFDMWGQWEGRFRKLLIELRRHNLRLPAFSFHTYGDDVSPRANARLALALRAMLDEHGMQRTELWNTEWQAGDFLRKHLGVDPRVSEAASADERRRFSVAAATYALSCKVRWQESLDRSYYYRANMRAFPPSMTAKSEMARAGLARPFSATGETRPLALQEKLTAEMLRHTPERCTCSAPQDEHVAVLAMRSHDGRKAAVLVCNLRTESLPAAVRWSGTPAGWYDAQLLSIEPSAPSKLTRKRVGRIRERADIVVPGLSSVLLQVALSSV